jgi:hypothetical protein
MRRAGQALHRLNLRTTLAAGAATLVLGAIAWYFGNDVWHAILIGCAVTALFFAARTGWSIPAVRDLSWRYRQRGTEGTRNEVATLARSLRSGWGGVGLTAERRLRQLARRRLALEGLDLRDDEHREAIERRIGASSYRLLTRPDGPRPRLRAVLQTLDLLDGLNADHYAAPQGGVRRGTPNRPNLRRNRER